MLLQNGGVAVLKTQNSIGGEVAASCARIAGRTRSCAACWLKQFQATACAALSLGSVFYRGRFGAQHKQPFRVLGVLCFGQLGAEVGPSTSCVEITRMASALRSCNESNPVPVEMLSGRLGVVCPAVHSKFAM